MTDMKWQPMETAPKNGKHCLVAIKSGSWVWAVQGAYMNREWVNAANIKAELLCWMPNPVIPNEFFPWTEEFKSNAESEA